MVYVKAEINVLPGKMDEFCELMKQLLPPIGELQWKLVASFINRSGRQGTVLNIWQIPDANAFLDLGAQLAKNDKARALLNAIHECIEPETATLVSETSFSPGLGGGA